MWFNYYGKWYPDNHSLNCDFISRSANICWPSGLATNIWLESQSIPFHSNLHHPPQIFFIFTPYEDSWKLGRSWKFQVKIPMGTHFILHLEILTFSFLESWKFHFCHGMFHSRYYNLKSFRLNWLKMGMYIDFYWRILEFILKTLKS